MTENDYIAEYVKERCPEMLETIDYSVWRFGKALNNLASTWVNTITNAFAFRNNIYEEDEEDEILKS